MKGLNDIREAVHELELPDNRSIWVDEIDNYRNQFTPMPGVHNAINADRLTRRFALGETAGDGGR